MSEITTVLTVNTSGGYTANPESVTVTKAETTLIYSLDRASAGKWQITGLSTTDSYSQAGPYTINASGTSVSFVDVNSVNTDFNVTVFVTHRESGAEAKIDPQVRNRPPG